MLTARGWWFLLSGWLLLLLGAPTRLGALALPGLVLLVWFGLEWLLFRWRSQQSLHVERTVGDDLGPAATLWAGQLFTVRVSLHTRGLRLPLVAAADFTPLNVEVQTGSPMVEGAVAPEQPLTWAYRIRCPAPGSARFEGVRVEISDFQGLFYHQRFVRAAVVWRVLPRLTTSVGARATTKRQNLLLPPGIHRLYRPGSGSELLDLRDYRDGDPPKTIAWKVSARRDKLITKEFESEVPVRCTLFLDISHSVRLAGPGPDGTSVAGKALDRMVELAAGLLQIGTAAHDPTGLCLFDERGVSLVRPDRTGTHLTQMLQKLAEAATLAPMLEQVDPDLLLPLAYSFAEDVYPELLRQEVNAVPWWLTWFIAFPSYSRHSRLFLEFLLFHKRLAITVVALLVSLVVRALPLREAVLLLLLLTGPLLLPLAVYYLIVRLNTGRRRQQVWRKRLAALLSVRYGLAPAGVEAFLEDDDAFALYMQRFLADHRVPFCLPLYDAQGRYRFGSPEKVAVLAGALLAAVSRGHDNELFVLLADLVELDDHLAPLVRAVRVALARHHQVVLICPWPPGVPLPTAGGSENLSAAGWESADADELWGRATLTRLHAAYQRIRRMFARLGVPVVCAVGEEPTSLVLERLDRLRMLGRRR